MYIIFIYFCEYIYTYIIAVRKYVTHFLQRFPHGVCKKGF